MFQKNSITNKKVILFFVFKNFKNIFKKVLTLKNINVIIIKHSGKRQKNTKKSHKKTGAKLIQNSINFPKK